MPVSTTNQGENLLQRKQDLELLMSCLDLTSLNDTDNEETIDRLCQTATSSPVHPASVCIYPRFVKQAKLFFKDTKIKVCTVVNFPSGSLHPSYVTKEVKDAVEDGADEIDVVFNYDAINCGCTSAYGVAPVSAADKVLQDYEDVVLKVILETAALKGRDAIQRACRLSLAAGADFVKTSTGKHAAGGATLEAADAMLECIRECGGCYGLKVSGGIRTVDDAFSYLNLVRQKMWSGYASPQHFRIGASVLLDVLKKEYSTL
ncbi:deoxyribose-phosphate aldolase [Synchytrium microbalum]|uniref:deoxyribose-phosphate aldolase n=1 Tax=Synchytrium microbalum TaxID=1806994 RepID=A0A507C7H7_9FUNG|nr:deoxyribose-phosphate aldolase [Synchytrium microbalum]TPX33483.1 deoxyribose-phosphate aldolase [Synchytrium microbalum]